MIKKNYLDVEDLEVYKRLCQLHIDVCDLTYTWPKEEKYELGSQVRRSSNSSPAQLAEKNDDRHIRNKIEGVNRSRGEAGETIHHLFMAKLKGYITDKAYQEFRDRYKECVRMLNAWRKHWNAKCRKKIDVGRYQKSMLITKQIRKYISVVGRSLWYLNCKI